MGPEFQLIAELHHEFAHARGALATTPDEEKTANPTFATLIRIVKGFGIRLSDLATGIDRIRDQS